MDRTELLGKLTIGQFKTQSEYLSDKIKRMIISDEIDDGFIFPNENEFCRLLGVSRGTLRDAYKILDTQGFIERTKHGTYVKCRDAIARQGNFSASLELASTQEMIEFISAFEPEAASLAARKIDSKGISRLEYLLEECERKAKDKKALNEANYRFHEFIRTQTKNNLVISALTAYYDIFSNQVIDTIYFLLKQSSDDFRDNALRQHRELVDAIKAHDEEKARAIARGHLQHDLRIYAKLKR